MPPTRAQKLEIYKTGYTIASTRYDNIYKSVWTIFSYMTAISAAILSFGASHFYGELLALVASLPLVFWYLTTYIPLDRYGNQTLDNLTELESTINDEFETRVDHFSVFKTKRAERKMRARYPIHCFMILILIVAGVAFVMVLGKAIRGDKLLKPNETVKKVELI